MISTDKAVNPTNVMGASKRGAEISTSITRRTRKHHQIHYHKIGNVLGS
jgi:FlaA1/EpsC-like NDP-sugar epimerase